MTQAGVISRLEAVSMIPPLFLDVHSDHFVLDLCAAPGSKTQQILEMLKSGVVIANDANPQRALMLVNQTSHAPTSNLVVTSYLAQQFPIPKIAGKSVQFDRILCDVPCSSDGTLVRNFLLNKSQRKSPEIWATWSPQYAMSLHSLQLAILARAVKLLKIGGKIVYSTCSLNPIENEAVIMEIWRQSEGAIRLVDVSEKLSDLSRRNGLGSWVVTDLDNNVIPEGSEFIKDHAMVKRSFFPPNETERAKAHPEFAMRFYPHIQNHGGFFVCVLEKTAEVPSAFGELYNKTLTGIVKCEQQ